MESGNGPLEIRFHVDAAVPEHNVAAIFDTVTQHGCPPYNESLVKHWGTQPTYFMSGRVWVWATKKRPTDAFEDREGLFFDAWAYAASCGERKRHRPTDGLNPSNLPTSSLDDV